MATKRINNGISLVLVLVAIMGRKILVEIPKSLLRRGLLRLRGGIGEVLRGFGSGTEREIDSQARARSVYY